MQIAASNAIDNDAFKDAPADAVMERVLKDYDKYVVNSIINWISRNKMIDAKDIYRLASNNEDTNGTEKQFVLFAIEDLYNWMKKKRIIIKEQLTSNYKTKINNK